MFRHIVCFEQSKKTQQAQKTEVPNLAFLNRLLDLLDLDLAEAFDLQERFARRGVDGLIGSK